ncbi:hypothetical protein O3P69_015302 [Scylla paramamosain]|uniref:Microsomal glutathione S-transferase 1 n=1 Tax=Scylla paramamosain TaxID=85552 RepID=A0AAW0T3W9_SCYPA
MLDGVWSLDNPAFVSFVFYSTVLCLKMLFMGPLTGHYRKSRGIFLNPEDARAFGPPNSTCRIDPEVERVRRAHQNDVENIPVFIVLASLFLLTSPSAFTANMLFRSFTFCRVLYTIFYLRGSALRPVFYVIPLLICFYMSGCILAKFW